MIVLCHGVGLDQSMWDHQVAALSPYFRVVRYDLLGHGRTALPANVTTITDFIKQLEELLEFLGITNLVLAGFSMGGLIAQGFAKNASDRIEKLILMNTVYRRTNAELTGPRQRLQVTVDEGLESVTELAIDRWFNEAFKSANPDVINRIKARVLSNDIHAYATSNEIFVDADDHIGTALRFVQCPALVMTGELDTGATPKIAQRMAKDLLNARLVILRGLHHLAPLENPDRVNQVLLDFLGIDPSQK